MRRRDASRLSPDNWALVCSFLHREPRKIFMLLCAVKGLQFNDAWWATYWERHRAFNSTRKHRAHFYLGYEPVRPGQCKTLLRLVYGMFCSRCGCRFRHTIFERFRMRVCAECLRDNHISNVVLWFEYGLPLEAIAAEFRHYVRHHPLQAYKCPNEILCLTRNPLDIEFKGVRKMVFFWKPDLERLFDFEALRAAQVLRVSALNVLKAAFKRVFVAKARGRYFLEQLHTNEVKRIVKPMCPPKIMYGTNWSLASYADPRAACPTPTLNLSLALRAQVPLPVLADDEYTTKTALSKLKLNRESLQRKIQDWRKDDPDFLMKNKVYKV